jgi:hypothetical protein
MLLGDLQTHNNFAVATHCRQSRNRTRHLSRICRSILYREKVLRQEFRRALVLGADLLALWWTLIFVKYF